MVDTFHTKQKPTPKKRKLGTLQGKIKVIDPDWWRPMSDEEVTNFLIDHR